MTAAVAERVEHPTHTSLPSQSLQFPLDADGFTDLDVDVHLATLRRAADQAHARELLGLADLITQLSTHPHPDQAGELSDRRIQIMGRHHGHPFAAWTPL
ncbi:hypothetical protein AB1207_12230, partial [Kineococcus endophyticus]